ncbi:response regulator [bacterium]|nr:response regulator [bacterium]MDY3022867.1 response regulator [Oliverpabstia sp.]
MKYQVLLVDDELIYLQYLQKMIDWEILGCEICGCAQNGEEAIRMVEDRKPDIVFMDINMSQMDGLEACAALREKKCGAKVIIMTAFNEFSFAHRAIKLNVFDYLLKPFDEEEFEWIAVGNVVDGIENLQKTYQDAQMVRENRVKLVGPVNCFEDVQQLHSEITLMNTSDVNLLIKAFEMKEYDKVDQMIEKMFALSKNQMFSFQYVIATYYSLVTGIYGYYHYNEENNLTDMIGTQANLVSEIGMCSTTQQMLDIVRNYVYEAFSDCMNVRVGSKKEILVAKIEQYLQQHYAEKSLSVNQIAEHLYFENSYIRRVFKMQTGKTIIQRLEEIRIEKARELLAEGTYKNSEVAELTGYCDQYYFSKRFKLFCGCSPSEYQKREI